MKQLILIVFFLFMAVILYLISLPPKEITLKDLQPGAYPRSIEEETETQEIAAVDSTKEFTKHSIPSGPETGKTAAVDRTKEVFRSSIPNEPKALETSAGVNTKAESDAQSKVEYYIILEGFSNLMLAKQSAEKLKKELNANIIVLPRTAEGLYRISYGKYSTYEEAKSLIQNIRTKIKSDAWIFSLKK